MLRSAKEIQGYTIHARDGDIGRVYTFYFGDESWCVRYLVVDTGSWLPGKQVLISPIALGHPDWESQHLPVTLSKEQVQNSPAIDTDRPVSRQQEIALHTHYNWPGYWLMPDPVVAQGLLARPGGALLAPPAATPVPEPLDERRYDSHLRSMREVMGYYIQASDGRIGHVEDFIVDCDTWHLRYMVVNTRNWLPGKKVLIAPNWIREVNWADSQVHLDLSQDHVRNSPEYEATAAVNRDYEMRLYDYYGRPAYWN